MNRWKSIALVALGLPAGLLYAPLAAGQEVPEPAVCGSAPLLVLFVVVVALVAIKLKKHFKGLASWGFLMWLTFVGSLGWAVFLGWNLEDAELSKIRSFGIMTALIHVVFTTIVVLTIDRLIHKVEDLQEALDETRRSGSSGPDIAPER
jgi:hypothetical protein